MSARVCLRARRFSSSSVALTLSPTRARSVSSAGTDDSRRAMSEGPDGITGYSSPGFAWSVGESRRPAVRSMNAIPVRPWLCNWATVSCLTGVPRSISSVTCTCSTLPGARAIPRTLPTSTPR